MLGSVEIFGDEWLDKEENAKLCDVLFSWLLNETDLDMTSDRQVNRTDESNVPADCLSGCLTECHSIRPYAHQYARLLRS